MIQQRKNYHSLTKADSKKKTTPAGRRQVFSTNFEAILTRPYVRICKLTQPYKCPNIQGSEPPRKILLNAISRFGKKRMNKRWIQRSKSAKSFWCVAASCALRPLEKIAPWSAHDAPTVLVRRWGSTTRGSPSALLCRSFLARARCAKALPP